MDDKRQITATFAVSSTGHFLPIQVIYEGENNPLLTKFQFPKSFSVTFSENHWSNTEKSVEFFEEIIFPYLKKVKEEKGFPNEQISLIIMDTIKGQDNDTVKELCAVNHCEIVIVPIISPISFSRWTFQLIRLQSHIFPSSTMNGFQIK